MPLCHKLKLMQSPKKKYRRRFQQRWQIRSSHVRIADVNLYSQKANKIFTKKKVLQMNQQDVQIAERQEKCKEEVLEATIEAIIVIINSRNHFEKKWFFYNIIIL